MHFFSSITAMDIIGLVLLAVGAVLNFAAKPLSRFVKPDGVYVPLIIKTAGLGLVIVAFLMIIGVIA